MYLYPYLIKFNNVGQHSDKYLPNNGYFVWFQQDYDNSKQQFIFSIFDVNDNDIPSNGYIFTNHNIYQTDINKKIISQQNTSLLALTNNGSKFAVKNGNAYYLYYTYASGAYSASSIPLSEQSKYIYIKEGDNIYLTKPANNYSTTIFSVNSYFKHFAIIDNNNNYNIYYLATSQNQTANVVGNNQLLPYWSPSYKLLLNDKPTLFINNSDYYLNLGYSDKSLWRINPATDTDNVGIVTEYPIGNYALHHATDLSIIQTLGYTKPPLDSNNNIQSFPMVYEITNNSNAPIQSGININLNYINETTIYKYETHTYGLTTTPVYTADRIIAYGSYEGNSNVLVYYDYITKTYSKDDYRVRNKYYIGNNNILYKSQSTSGLLDTRVNQIGWVTYDSSNNYNPIFTDTHALFSGGSSVNMTNKEGTIIYVESNDAANPNHSPAQNGLKMYCVIKGDSFNSNGLKWHAFSVTAEPN